VLSQRVKEHIKMLSQRERGLFGLPLYGTFFPILSSLDLK
jgi:hypothetical protein